MISWQSARSIVIERVARIARSPESERVPRRESLMRVLAQEICADRDYPPFDRSVRDGYALRAADTGPGKRLRCIAEIKAGDTPKVSVAPGTCVQIMTGAALPQDADAVLMLEHTSREGDSVTLQRGVKPGQHLVRRGSEIAGGRTIVGPGRRIGFDIIAAAAQVGLADLLVFRKPRIAILSTGDEIVSADSAPGQYQMRNSNAEAIAAQVGYLNATPVVLPVAQDSRDSLRACIAAGLREDALVLSGGVSAGKYDLVEPVLKELGAEIIFDAVAIRPGKPTVFALCDRRPVFGLPGNPVSTMVTFDLFARPALDLLSGQSQPRPPLLLEAVLQESLSAQPGLAHFLPGVSEYGESPRACPLHWQGSGDVAAMSRANCLLLVPPERETIEAGERIQIMPRGAWF